MRIIIALGRQVRRVLSIMFQNTGHALVYRRGNKFCNCVLAEMTQSILSKLGLGL